MKILDVVTESREIEILDEALGTLSQLNAGPLINVIKQSGYTSGRGARATPVISKDQPKFQKPDIGSESPIVDAGKIKSQISEKRIKRLSIQLDSRYISELLQ